MCLLQQIPFKWPAIAIGRCILCPSIYVRGLWAINNHLRVRDKGQSKRRVITNKKLHAISIPMATKWKWIFFGLCSQWAGIHPSPDSKDVDIFPVGCGGGESHDKDKYFYFLRLYNSQVWNPTVKKDFRDSWPRFGLWHCLNYCPLHWSLTKKVND